MAHLMERYFTNVPHVGFTDRLIEATMKTIIAKAPKLQKNPKDYDAWSEFMWAGTLAHNNLLNTGRIGDWASHDIEHEISGIYDVAHGAGLAVVFPAWMKHVLRHDLDRFVQWAVRVWNVELDIFDLEATARQGVARHGGRSTSRSASPRRSAALASASIASTRWPRSAPTATPTRSAISSSSIAPASRRFCAWPHKVNQAKATSSTGW